MIGSLERALVAEVTAENLIVELAPLAGDAPGDDLRRLADVLAEVVLAVPDALARALSLGTDERCGRAVTFATGSILHYLFDPDDLLPESSYEHLGLLDDAYLVHTFVAGLSRAYPFVDGDNAYLPPSAASLAVVAALLPGGVAESLVRTTDTIILVAQALFASAAGAAPAGIEHRPAIRVAEAIAALA